MKVKKQQSATIETDWSGEKRTVDDDENNRLILDRTKTAKISHHCCCHSNSKSKSKSSTKNSMRSTMKLSDSLVHSFVLVVFVALFSSSSIVVVNAAPANNPANGLNVVKLPALYWNVNNRLFSDSNQEPNYYLKLNAHMGESIDLVCPRSTQTNTTEQQKEDENTYAVIYRVGSRHEFDNCIVDAANNYETVAILKCDKPHAPQTVKFTINFVKYSPVPNALEFEEDREYYFLSTSSGARDGLHYASGGLCAKFNMRFSITIHSSAAQQQQKQQRPNHLLSKLSRPEQMHHRQFGDDDENRSNDETSELDEESNRLINRHSVSSSSSDDDDNELNSSNMMNLMMANYSTSYRRTFSFILFLLSISLSLSVFLLL